MLICRTALFRYLILHMIDQDRVTSNDSLGQVVIDLRTFDPEKRLHQTYPLADLVRFQINF